MVFHITFMLALFHDKKVLKLHYFISLYFVGFNCNEFSIKLVKIAQEVDLVTCLMSGVTYESHMRSTCWKLKSQVSGCIS